MDMKIIYVILAAVAAIFAMSGCCKPTESHPEWSYNAVMYELNTRQFTDEGTFRAAEQHLPRLKELGVDIIWFMPIHPIGVEARAGELGSYYSAYDYKAVNPEFGTMDDFRHFVDAAHAMGFKVIIDWVPNHTSRDAVWIDNKDWYVLDENGSPLAPYNWTDVAKLNYANEDMRAAMTEAMRFWLAETGIDGYRVDHAEGVPMEFWAKTLKTLKKENDDLFFLAEAEGPEFHTEGGFDETYAWELHGVMNKLAQETFTIDSLRNYLTREQKKYPKNAFRLAFTSNHDENSWNGTEFERMGDAAETFAALSYVLPGMPLVYNGQEVGLDRRLAFFVKDSIVWSDRDTFTELYANLNDLKHRNHSLAAGEKGGPVEELPTDNPEQVFAFSREKEGNRVISIFNLSSRPAEVKVNFSGKSCAYLEPMSGKAAIILNTETAYTLEPWEYRIYENITLKDDSNENI